MFSFFFFFNDTATTEIYTLSLHDALPISRASSRSCPKATASCAVPTGTTCTGPTTSTSPQARSSGSTCGPGRSEEHTSELQSRLHLVCRLLLEKKKKKPAGLDRIETCGCC